MWVLVSAIRSRNEQFRTYVATVQTPRIQIEEISTHVLEKNEEAK
jgi:hypothetical protein